MGKASKRKILNNSKKANEMPDWSVQMAAIFRKPIVHILIILILGTLIYSNTFNVPFVLDDPDNITNNQAIKDFHFIGTPHAKSGFISSNRFIGHLTFALNYKIHALNVVGYHIFNLLIHLLNALLVYWLVVLTFRTPYTSEYLQGDILKESSPYYWIPLFTALLFVCHPIQTQAVTYIVQRLASLATLFYLLSLVMYIKARGIDPSIKARCAYYAVSIISAVLAMKTKEIAFTLPVMIILYEFMFFKEGIKKKILYLAPFLLTMLIIPLTLMGSKISAISISKMDKITKIAASADVSQLDYLFTQFRVIVTYIRLLFFPINQNQDYDYPIYRSFFHPEVLLSFLFLAALFGLGIYLFYKSYRAKQGKRIWLRLVSLGIFWFFITLSVESSIIPIADVIFEHRLYLPSVGFCIALISGIILIKERWAGHAPIVQKALIPALILVVFALSAATFARNMVWQDEVTLWEDVVRKSPDKARPHYNLGVLYGMQGRSDDAIKEYQTAIKFDPHYADAHNNIGLLYEAQARKEDAIMAHQMAIKSNPYSAVYHINLCKAYFNQGRFTEAVPACQMAIKLRPDYADAHNCLGLVYMEQDYLDVAAVELRIAIKLRPDFADAHNNLGAVYGKQGRFDVAAVELQMAIKLKPNHVDAHRNLGLVYNKQGRVADAISAFQSVLKIDPDDKGARQNLEALSRTMKK